MLNFKFSARVRRKKYREIKNRNNARIGNQSEVFPGSPKISVRQGSPFPRLTVINGVSFSCTSRNFLSCSGKGHAYSHPSFPRGYSRRDTCELPTIGCPKTTLVSRESIFSQKIFRQKYISHKKYFSHKINISCNNKFVIDKVYQALNKLNLKKRMSICTYMVFVNNY